MDDCALVDRQVLHGSYKGHLGHGDDRQLEQGAGGDLEDRGEEAGDEAQKVGGPQLLEGLHEGPGGGGRHGGLTLSLRRTRVDTGINRSLSPQDRGDWPNSSIIGPTIRWYSCQYAMRFVLWI